MDFEALQSELRSQLEPVLERMQRSGSQSEQGRDYASFKKEIHRAVFQLIDRHKLEFLNREESERFLEGLRPSIETMVSRYFS